MKDKYQRVTIEVIESNQHVLNLYLSEEFIIDGYVKIYKNYELCFSGI